MSPTENIRQKEGEICLNLDARHIILHLLRKSNDSREKFKKDLQADVL